MQIREAHAGDLVPLLKLYTQLHNNPMPEMTDELATLWDTILRDPNHHVIVAEEGGELVSSCVLVVIPNLTCGQRPYAVIENVITHERYRRRGYAMRVLDFARIVAVQNNCYKIMLMTGSKQVETLRFYECAGYNSHDKTAFIQWLE